MNSLKLIKDYVKKNTIFELQPRPIHCAVRKKTHLKRSRSSLQNVSVFERSIKVHRSLLGRTSATLLAKVALSMATLNSH